MSQIQSNYPRFLARPVSLDELASLRRSAAIGQSSLFVLWTLIMILTCFPKLMNHESEVIGVDFLLAIGVFGSLICSLWATMFWVTRAHRAVCSLRGISSRIHSRLVGFGSGIPYLLFFAPLCYALDFLVIRSASPDQPTMRWTSLVSQSKIVTAFALCMICDSGIALYEVIVPSGKDQVEPLDILSMTILLVGIVLGIRIAKIVNANIEALAAQQS